LHPPPAVNALQLHTSKSEQNCSINNGVFLSRNYRLKVTPRKYDVLKTNICPGSFEGKHSSLKNKKFPRRNYQTESLYCSPAKLRARLKIMFSYFQPFQMKGIKAKVHFKKKADKFRLPVFHFKPACLQNNFHGYFTRTVTMSRWILSDHFHVISLNVLFKRVV